MYLQQSNSKDHRFRNDISKAALMGTLRFLSAIYRCGLFVLGLIGAVLAWLVALRSLPCHMGSSYYLGCLGIEPRTSPKELAQPPRVLTTRIARHSLEKIEKCKGSEPEQRLICARKLCFRQSIWGSGVHKTSIV